MEFVLVSKALILFGKVKSLLELTHGITPHLLHFQIMYQEVFLLDC